MDFSEMEVPQFHMNWGSDSNTLDNSTMMLAADCNVAPSGYYQRLLLDEVMIPPYSDGPEVDHADVLQFLDDMEQMDWPIWDPAPEVDHANVLQNEQMDWPIWDPVPEVDHTNVLQNVDDMEQMDRPIWDPAPELNWEPSQQQLSSWEPTEQLQLNREPSQELQCPPTSETMPEISTVAQSEETNETGEEDGSGEEDQSPKCGGECSYNHTDESTAGLTSLPLLPSGKKIGVSYHKKNKQWEAHLWVKGPQLRGRKKKGVQIFLGNFNTEVEAKEAHDRAAIKLKMQPSARGKPYPLNFPAAVHSRYMEEHAGWTIRDFLWKIRRNSNKFSKGKSRLRGVSVKIHSVKRGQEWVTKYESKLSLTDKEFGNDVKQMFNLGNFESEEEAGQAYDRALLFLYQHQPEVEQLRCITNYRPSSYSAEDIEAMASKLQAVRQGNDDCSQSAAA